MSRALLNHRPWAHNGVGWRLFGLTDQILYADIILLLKQ
jgi:hypothetical protein